MFLFVVLLQHADLLVVLCVFGCLSVGTKSISLPKESRRKGVYNAGIVFVVGGVTYTEYHNIKEWGKKQKVPKKIIVGSTSMLNAETFIDELSRFSTHYKTGSMD